MTVVALQVTVSPELPVGARSPTTTYLGFVPLFPPSPQSPHPSGID